MRGKEREEKGKRERDGNQGERKRRGKKGKP